MLAPVIDYNSFCSIAAGHIVSRSTAARLKGDLDKQYNKGNYTHVPSNESGSKVEQKATPAAQKPISGNEIRVRDKASGRTGKISIESYNAHKDKYDKL